MSFIFSSPFKPAGDQPKAIKKLVAGLKSGEKAQTLLGVTGSGKTYTMAKVIEATQRPTLIISHNKTLAAQLYGEMRQFFPNNAVHYFVSYYDYYQPEAYIPHTDTYIEKEATINEEIDRLRHASTQSLMNRNDVIIVASVSCIYGLGEKEDYAAMSQIFSNGEIAKRGDILTRLIGIQYERNDAEFKRGQFRVSGDIIDIHLATGETVVRLQMFGDMIDEIKIFNIKPGKELTWAETFHNVSGQKLQEITILPAKHFMTPIERLRMAIVDIRLELKQRLDVMIKEGKEIEAYRLEKKTNYDLEMMEQIGYCNGIENYSRHLSNRHPGQPPATLIDFFPKDLLIMVDESHVTIPQIGGMFAGDQSRKQTLIDFGFRLPSARDNRPLNFQEFEEKINQIIFVSATPGPYELRTSSQIAEQIVRPTGLIEPKIELRPSKNQIQDLMSEIELTVKKKQRVLITTLTKRMAEELSAFLSEHKIKVQYLHSEVDTMERVEILRDLRSGKFDVLVGINLLREGLDLPEVSLVIILDADVPGFLRTETSLIQTMGRAARHLDGQVIMYGDKITPAMSLAIKETDRRRKIQEAYNRKHNITPASTTAQNRENMLDENYTKKEGRN